MTKLAQRLGPIELVDDDGRHTATVRAATPMPGVARLPRAVNATPPSGPWLPS